MYELDCVDVRFIDLDNCKIFEDENNFMKNLYLDIAYTPGYLNYSKFFEKHI